MTKKEQKKLNKQLQKVIIKQDLEGVRSALGAGADPNKRTTKGSRLDERLFFLVGSCGLSEAIFKTDNYSNRNNMVGLCLQRGTSEILQELISSGADLNKDISIFKAKSGFLTQYVKPICYAICNNQMDNIRVILDSNKMDPSVPVNNGSITLLDFVKKTWKYRGFEDG